MDESCLHEASEYIIIILIQESPDISGFDTERVKLQNVTVKSLCFICGWEVFHKVFVGIKGYVHT